MMIGAAKKGKMPVASQKVRRRGSKPAAPIFCRMSSQGSGDHDIISSGGQLEVVGSCKFPQSNLPDGKLTYLGMPVDPDTIKSLNGGVNAIKTPAH